MALTWKEAIEVIDFPYNWGNREVILDVIRRTVDENQETIDEIKKMGVDPREKKWPGGGPISSYMSQLCDDYYTCRDFLANYEPPGGTREIENVVMGRSFTSGISWDNERELYIAHLPISSNVDGGEHDDGIKRAFKRLDDCKRFLRGYNIQPDGTRMANDLDYWYFQSVGYRAFKGEEYDDDKEIIPHIEKVISLGGHYFRLRGVPPQAFKHIYEGLIKAGRVDIAEIKPCDPESIPDYFSTIVFVDWDNWKDAADDMEFVGFSSKTATLMEILEIAAKVDYKIKHLIDKYKGVKGHVQK